MLPRSDLVKQLFCRDGRPYFLPFPLPLSLRCPPPSAGEKRGVWYGKKAGRLLRVCSTSNMEPRFFCFSAMRCSSPWPELRSAAGEMLTRQSEARERRICSAFCIGFQTARPSSPPCSALPCPALPCHFRYTPRSGRERRPRPSAPSAGPCTPACAGKNSERDGGIFDDQCSNPEYSSLPSALLSDGGHGGAALQSSGAIEEEKTAERTSPRTRTRAPSASRALRPPPPLRG